jgi:ubiquinone/menaquinone biosynthesis C-methylase UbiE
MNEVEAQRAFFSGRAASYDQTVEDEFEHFFALSWLVGMMDHFGWGSLLDVGSGTGRALAFVKDKRPSTRMIGIEPVEALRKVGHAKGISEDELINGDALKLSFGDESFDVVTEFGVLHHIKQSHVVVDEMLRVAKQAVFISDSNNFGQGSGMGRFIKQVINAVGLWKLADMVKTRGRGYHFSEGDGVFYSYSVFNDYQRIARRCCSVYLLNTSKDANGVNPYRSAHTVALLGLKKQPAVRR